MSVELDIVQSAVTVARAHVVGTALEHLVGGAVSTKRDGDRLFVLMDDGSSFEVTVSERHEPCPYIHAHTRYFCGHPFCRES